MLKFYENVAQAMSSASSIEDLRLNFHASMAAFDLNQYTYQVVRHSSLQNMQNYFVTTYPKEWEQHYIEQNYFDSDPLVHKYLTSSAPFVYGVDSFANDNSKAKKMIIESSDFNLQHGIGIPIPGPNQSFSILTLCSQNSTSKEVKELYDHFYKDLLICGLMFHSSFLSLSLNNHLGSSFDLTNKEIECLKWICAGKSNTDIASILAVTVDAIKERNKSIFRKLGVYSRVEAVIKAYRYRIVEL